MELLSPAGTSEALDAAIASGADAVYLGLKSFNARMRSANFAYSQFEALVKTLRRRGKKVYATVNTVFEEREADRMFQLLKYLSQVGPDAIIVQDFGVLAMARRFFPSLKIHASTQMNIASADGINFLSKHGVSRVVLARELPFDEISAIRAASNCELEVFVHGALCVSVSGLCLFSSFLGGKSANRGMCTQVCRRLFQERDAGADLAAEGGQSGYFFSPLDLQLITKVPLLYKVGVSALKIEGRMKSAEYVGAVTLAYRRVIDACAADEGDAGIEKAVREAERILQSDYARGKTLFHFEGGNSGYLAPNAAGGTGIRLGTVARTRGTGADYAVLVRPPRQEAAHSVSIGDSLRFHRADDSRRETNKITHIEEKNGALWLSAPEGFFEGDTVYLVQSKAETRRYPRVIPNDLSAFRRMPGHDKAPRIEIRLPDKPALSRFPEGVYIAASQVQDLFIAQSAKCAGFIVDYSEKTAASLLGGALPHIPREKIIVKLPAVFPGSSAKKAAEILPRLAEKGYFSFIVNNLGQISIINKLKADDIVLIAGPFLYSFNSYSAAFLREARLQFYVTPLENSRQNLLKTFSIDGKARAEAALRAGVFVTIYAHPPLFQIGGSLRDDYSFDSFSDKEGECFRLSTGAGANDGACVVPETPFSIVDKMPFLKKAGFVRFIVDFSPAPLKKAHFKTIMKAVDSALVITPGSRFNWKNGFYAAQ